MDYDVSSIPEGYDRGRSYGPEVLELWIRKAAAYAGMHSIRNIADVECGTGRYSVPLAVHFGARVVGIDPSRKMLEQARAKAPPTSVRYELGSGEALPLADGSVDLVFASMIFHHLIDPAALGLECRRVLGANGYVFLRNRVQESSGQSPYAPFFPSSVALMQERLPSRQRVREVFERAGFTEIDSGEITQQLAPS